MVVGTRKKPISRAPKGTGRLCAFCNQRPAKKSKEHVFPKWFLREFGLLKHTTRPMSRTFEPLTGEFTGEALHERPAHPLDQYRAGGVCTTCNNGWMSELETAAKPLMLRLIKRERILTYWGDLSPEESSLLARWTFKTACAMDLPGGTPENLIIPASQRHAFYAAHHEPPPNIWVFSAQRPHTGPVDFRAIEGPPMTRFGSLPDDQHPRLEDFYENLYGEGVTKHYMVGIQMIGLVLGLFYWPFRQYPVMPVPGFHHPLWVPTHPDTAIVPATLRPEGVRELMALDSHAFTGAFLENLAVFVP